VFDGTLPFFGLLTSRFPHLHLQSTIVFPSLYALPHPCSFHEASHVLKRLLNEGDATAPSSASRKKHRLSKSGIDGGGGGFSSQPKKRRKVVKDEDSTMTAPVLLEGDEEDLPPPAAPPLAMVESLGSSSVAGKTVDEGETESILGAPPPPLSLGLKAENAVEKTLNLVSSKSHTF
jgi:hypothetical protein